MADGLIDTNMFLHAQTHDAHSEECIRFLEAIKVGAIQAHLEPMVLHELSYALPHYRREMTRPQVARYLLSVLAWEGITGEKARLINAVERWRVTPGLAFVDAFLASMAKELDCAIYTKNVAELTQQGATVPNPLPAPMP
jgi:predicted nucleic acid-binding protein